MKVILLWVFYPLIRPLYLFSLILNTLMLSIVIIAVSPFDRHGRALHYIGKLWAFINLYLPGTRVSVEGKEKLQANGAYVIMSNHQSLLDPWILIAKLPFQLRWIIKSGVKRMPVFGYALKRMGHIFVDKNSRKGMVESVRMAEEQIGRGASVVIFPEGTRSRDGRLLEFQRGGAVIAARTGVPILPVTINGSRFVLPKGTLALMPGKIKVVIGDPIDPRGITDAGRDGLMGTVRAHIEKNLDLKYGDLVS